MYKCQQAVVNAIVKNEKEKKRGGVLIWGSSFCSRDIYSSYYRKEVMYMYDEERKLRGKIHYLEDLLLRSKDPREQEQLSSKLMILRITLKKMENRKQDKYGRALV